MRYIIVALSTLIILGIVSANIQIQTNIENAVHTIKQIFITTNGLAQNPANTLVSINADNSGTMYIKNKLETDGSIVANGVPTTSNPSNHKILTIADNNTIYKTDIANLALSGGSSNQREQTAQTLSTNKIVGINNIGLNHQFWVGGTSIFQSGSNIIYIYPNNQYSSTNGGFASRNNNLKINTKTQGLLYINYDVTANTIIKGNVSVGEGANPTAAIDIYTPKGHDQLRLRNTFAPQNSNDTQGQVGNITRGYDEGRHYLYIKTDEGWKRSVLESF